MYTLIGGICAPQKCITHKNCWIAISFNIPHTYTILYAYSCNWSSFLRAILIYLTICGYISRLSCTYTFSHNPPTNSIFNIKETTKRRLYVNKFGKKKKNEKQDEESKWGKRRFYIWWHVTHKPIMLTAYKLMVQRERGYVCVRKVIFVIW